MGPDLELKERSEIVMEASVSKENANVVKEPEDNNMRCACNYEDNAFETEALTYEEDDGGNRNEDVEVNIIEDINSGGAMMVEAEGQDATEDSSSFGGSVSEIEDCAMPNDLEVESDLRGDDTPALEFDGCSEVFRARKKKLTSHWRTFIQPLMWRCKWVELQIKKFQAQAMKYDRELGQCNQRKWFEQENFTLEDFGARLLPFSSHCQRKRVMKRKKRKRIEAMDVASYMSHHNLFSYYDNKRSAADGASMDYEWGNPVISAGKIANGTNEFGIKDELLSLDFRDSDGSSEQILQKIGIVQSQIAKLKTRLGKVMSENAGRFSSTDQLSLLVPCDALTSSAQNPASPPNNGFRTPGGSSIVSQLMSEYNMGDLVVPESAVSSNGEVMHLPDIIESTVQVQVGDLYKNSGDGILIYNRRAHEELNNFEEVKMLPVEKAKVPKEEKKSTIPQVSVPEPTEDQPRPKIRSISKLTAPKNKRKRGRRKAGSGKWSRRSSV